MIEALKSYTQPSIQGELRCVVRTLQACSLTPGFIDVYNEDKESIGQHGTRILNVKSLFHLSVVVQHVMFFLISVNDYPISNVEFYYSFYCGIVPLALPSRIQCSVDLTIPFR